MASNYARGRRFEHRIAEELQKRGYYTILSAGSHSVTDVMAVKAGAVLFVQCKKHGALPPGEWNELMDQAEAHGGIPILADQEAPRRPLRFWLLTLRKTDRKRIERRQAYTP